MNKEIKGEENNLKNLKTTGGNINSYDIDLNLLFQNKIAVPEYIPTKLAAFYLGISENALRIKVCRKEIPARKFGRSLRFHLPELAALLKQRE